MGGEKCSHGTFTEVCSRHREFELQHLPLQANSCLRPCAAVSACSRALAGIRRLRKVPDSLQTPTPDRRDNSAGCSQLLPMRQITWYLCPCFDIQYITIAPIPKS
eukprot:1552950-Amphidinium_carterae.1